MPYIISCSKNTKKLDMAMTKHHLPSISCTCRLLSEASHPGGTFGFSSSTGAPFLGALSWFLFLHVSSNKLFPVSGHDLCMFVSCSSFIKHAGFHRFSPLLWLFLGILRVRSSWWWCLLTAGGGIQMTSSALASIGGMVAAWTNGIQWPKGNEFSDLALKIMWYRLKSCPCPVCNNLVTSHDKFELIPANTPYRDRAPAQE